MTSIQQRQKKTHAGLQNIRSHQHVIRKKGHLYVAYSAVNKAGVSQPTLFPPVAVLTLWAVHTLLPVWPLPPFPPPHTSTPTLHHLLPLLFLELRGLCSLTRPGAAMPCSEIVQVLVKLCTCMFDSIQSHGRHLNAPSDWSSGMCGTLELSVKFSIQWINWSNAPGDPRLAFVALCSWLIWQLNRLPCLWWL